MSSVRSMPKGLAAILQENPQALAQLKRDFANQLKVKSGGGNRFFNSVSPDILLADVGPAWLQEYRGFLTSFKVNSDWYNQFGDKKDLLNAFINPSDVDTYKMFINRIASIALDVILDQNASLDLAWINQLDPQRQEQQLALDNEKLIINLVLSYLERVSVYLKHGSINEPGAQFVMGKLGVAQAMEMLFNQYPQDIIDFIKHELASRRGSEFHAVTGIVGLRPLTINVQSGSTPKSAVSTSSTKSDDKHHFAFTPSTGKHRDSLSDASSSSSTPSSGRASISGAQTPSSSRSTAGGSRVHRQSIDGGSNVPPSIAEDQILPGSLMAHYAMFYKSEVPGVKTDGKPPVNKLKK